MAAGCPTSYSGYYPYGIILGPVVQRWISSNPGLKFNLLSWLYSCTSFYLKNSENKISVDPNKISEETFPNL
jgi:hypothetical protein